MRFEGHWVHQSVCHAQVKWRKKTAFDWKMFNSNMVDVRFCVNGITCLGPTHPSEKFVVFSLAEGYS